MVQLEWTEEDKQMIIQYRKDLKAGKIKLVRLD